MLDRWNGSCKLLRSRLHPSDLYADGLNNEIRCRVKSFVVKFTLKEVRLKTTMTPTHNSVQQITLSAYQLYHAIDLLNFMMSKFIMFR